MNTKNEILGYAIQYSEPYKDASAGNEIEILKATPIIASNGNYRYAYSEVAYEFAENALLDLESIYRAANFDSLCPNVEGYILHAGNLETIINLFQRHNAPEMVKNLKLTRAQNWLIWQDLRTRTDSKLTFNFDSGLYVNKSYLVGFALSEARIYKGKYFKSLKALENWLKKRAYSDVNETIKELYFNR